MEYRKIKNKKGQEEMVGFAMIIIIVAVVGLLIFGLALRGKNNASTNDNYEISQFLGSVMQITTECTLRTNIDYASVNELVKECYQNSYKQCMDSKSVCGELNKTFKTSIVQGLRVGVNMSNKGYILNISFEGNSGVAGEEVLELKSGECKGELTGGEYLIPQSKKNGLLIARLTLCK